VTNREETMTPDALREAYLRFFEERGHTRHPSDSLVPENDPTLLFTGAGMNQFKAEFLGKGTLPFTRATTTQKCLRMPDLDNVGRTASHHTFFEMLGNFSFGDYFKDDAIAWAWELLGVLGLPADRLSVTVYKDDDEAAAIWVDGAGISPDRVYRCDEDENFWPASAPTKGPNGICGPCSEIYFDFHPEQGDYPAEGPAVDGARFVEIWNLVFTQFERGDGGVLTPLPSRNIDTGMGFERIVRVVESAERGEVLASNFETRLFAPIMAAIHEHVGLDTSHGTPEGTRTRRIADHVRAACFCIGDGVRPSNEKQGYVVRKVLRRAMLDRHLLGGDLRQPWLETLAGTIIDTMGEAWPALRDARSMIASTIAGEEEKFAAAFLSGSQKLGVMARKVTESGGDTLPGDQAFLLYDTFGLPLDMQLPLLQQEGLAVDEEGFRAAMAEQRRRSREGSRIPDSIFDEGPLASVSGSLPATEFSRDGLELQGANILAIVDDDTEEADIEEGASGDQRKVVVVLDRTPFYAEGGGQVGDTGTLVGDDFTIEVDDVVSMRGISLHRGVVLDGEPSEGPVTAQVDHTSRSATQRNHTATHLLHAALRDVLGDEVTQAGSLVAPDRLRFDFRFPRGLSDDELREVEERVNRWILANSEVGATEMPMSEARDRGAMALFGEKYGDVVRVVRVAGVGPEDHGAQADSVELCGGTHVTRSGDIGLLRITSEGSVAAGIRRVEARTGVGVLDLARSSNDALARTAGLLKTSPDRIEERVTALQSDLKAARRQLDALRAGQAGQALSGGRQEWNGLAVVLAVVEGVPPKDLRDLVGKEIGSGQDVVVLAAPDGDATHYLAATGDKARQAGVEANAIVSRLAEALGGRGGGKPAFAQGRGGPSDDLPAVLRTALEGGNPPPS
jgi:alanyl-tRNA synthetase